MTSPAPGWYPDPHVDMQMRWWDGSAWTDDTYERTEPLGDLGAVPSGGQRASERGAAGAPMDVERAPGAVRQEQPRVARPVGLGSAVARRTDDGVPLAGWWWRVLARLVDNLLTGLVVLVVAWPATREVATYFVEQSQEIGAAAEQGEGWSLATPSPSVAGALYALTVWSLVVSVLYEMGFLLWKGATPGKLLVGLKVRRVKDDDRLDLTTVAKRVLASLIAWSVPQIGVYYLILDSFWPLRDVKRQALHDKFARTCVVRPRR